MLSCVKLFEMCFILFASIDCVSSKVIKLLFEFFMDIDIFLKVDRVSLHLTPHNNFNDRKKNIFNIPFKEQKYQMSFINTCKRGKYYRVESDDFILNDIWKCQQTNPNETRIFSMIKSTCRYHVISLYSGKLGRKQRQDIFSLHIYW